MRLALAAALALLAAPALAQPAAPEGTPARIRGTVVKLEDRTLQMTARSGEAVALTLAANATIAGVVARRLEDIREGDYVATTSVRGPDGTLRALEVHFLPASAGEGQFAYDLVPDSLMTNAHVEGVSAAAQGRVLQVTYKGAQAAIAVPPEAPVVAFVPGDASLLKPGAAVVVSALQRPDGTVTALRVTAEKDGVKPPM